MYLFVNEANRFKLNIVLKQSGFSPFGQVVVELAFVLLVRVRIPVLLYDFFHFFSPFLNASFLPEVFMKLWVLVLTARFCFVI